MRLSRPVSLAIALTAVVFVIDLLTPLGVATGGLYALVVLLGLGALSPSQTSILACVASLLVVVGGWLSPPGGEVWMAVVNRVLSLALVWGISAAVLRYRAAADALQQQQRMKQAVLDTASVALFVLDRSGRVILANPAACALLRAPEHDILGSDWFVRWLPEPVRADVREVFAELVAGRLAGALAHENQILTGDGQVRLVSWQNAVLRDERGEVTGVLCSGEDITVRREAEEALGESRRALMSFKQALDQSAIVATTDARGRITYANDLFCIISGYARHELLGQDHRLVNSGTHPRAFIAELWRTIQAGEVWKGELCNRAKDGTLYWVDTTIVPFLDEAGRPWQYLAIRADITERKRVERALREQDALVRLGEMAAVVAHEVKNPLAGIAGAIQVIGGRLPAASGDRAVIAEILTRIDALNSTVQDLLVFARPRAPQPELFALSDLLRQTAQLLANDPQGEHVAIELPQQDTVVFGDADLLRHVFVNLMLNAAQAMGGHGRLVVTAITAGRFSRIAFADSGPGIPASVREHLFQPFFTTKHRGTGLGLAIARRIVEGHEGHIEVDCPASGGTVMTVCLPVAAREGSGGEPVEGTPARR